MIDNLMPLLTVLLAGLGAAMSLMAVIAVGTYLAGDGTSTGQECVDMCAPLTAVHWTPGNCRCVMGEWLDEEQGDEAP